MDAGPLDWRVVVRPEVAPVPGPFVSMDDPEQV
jgi:hypothetical protein